MSTYALIITKAVCVEYLLLRPECWPDILRDAHFIDTGPYRTYTLDYSLVGRASFIDLLKQLEAEQRYYHIVLVEDNPVEIPPDNETHHL